MPYFHTLNCPHQVVVGSAKLAQKCNGPVSVKGRQEASGRVLSKYTYDEASDTINLTDTACAFCWRWAILLRYEIASLSSAAEAVGVCWNRERFLEASGVVATCPNSVAQA